MKNIDVIVDAKDVLTEEMDKIFGGKYDVSCADNCNQPGNIYKDDSSISEDRVNIALF